MELLRQHLEERPTAERSPTQLGEAVGLSRSTIWRQLHQPSTSNEDELELRAQIQAEYNKAEVSTRAVDGIEDMIDQPDEGSWARSRRGRWWNSSLSQDWPR